MPVIRRTFYGFYCIALFVPVAVSVLIVNLIMPGVRNRRAVARHSSRLFLKAIGISLTVIGLERLPASPCVIVANHASYLDGLVVAAALPPDFAFVIKKEMVRVPLASLLLKRLGSEFVERFDRHKSAVDARRVLKRAANGQSVVFFPEGTFTQRRAIGKFHGGAFATAARNKMPIVALAVRGTRDAMPSGSLMIRRVPIHVEVLQIFEPRRSAQTSAGDLRQQTRALIAAAVGEALHE
jgi:1-acyl-sn-glycerol-3-phosphate acyltransferase